MIIWLNGAYGAGKTTTAGELVPLLPGARLFDAEQVGYMLGHVEGLPELGDFQHWPPWRHLVVETASQLLRYVGGTLVVTQTVLVRQYWEEIRDGLERAGVPVRHFVLHSDPAVLAGRIRGDALENRDWRLEHLDEYREALAWLREEASIVDTTHLGPGEAAGVVAEQAGEPPR
ncbi:ATP-binding protein [Streptomyces daqingensis]|uniref:ATP-binding protein n=1 Tax=Streptomyces daqingensis TaxID=1472640 RepID=A0ABQ2MUB6_9ACTN|nr:AAA family ATPase [Streptomyces daqingensis]GGO57936.1 ATP-binding protein [Streptomyces daqingensis]